MAVNPIPDGTPRVSPYLIVTDVTKTIDFLKEVFDAKELERIFGSRKRARSFPSFAKFQKDIFKQIEAGGSRGRQTENQNRTV